MTKLIKYCLQRNNKYLFIAITFVLLAITPLAAQRPSPSFGIGFQAGNPTGLSMQFYKSHGVTTDILLAYNLRDFFFMNIHGLWNIHLDPGEHFHFYYGPGGFIGIRDHQPEDRTDEVVAGFSGNFGLNFVISRVEFFGQVTPRLSVTPFTKFYGGGGVGMRFFF